MKTTIFNTQIVEIYFRKYHKGSKPRPYALLKTDQGEYV